MSIFKFINSKNRGAQSLKQGIDYILNREKTVSNLVSGNGVNTNTAYPDMKTVQTLFGKETGRSYVHFVISFDQEVSAEKAYIVANKCCNYFASEYQYILAVHTNTENCHAHVVLNTVNIQTGKKFSQSRKEMLDFRDFVNQCLIEYDLNPIGQTDSSALAYETGVLDDYENLVDIFEDDEVEGYNIPDSIFGFVDPDEISQISYAEVRDSDMKKIIHYFEGEAEELPPNSYFEDAEIQYLLWKDSQRWFEDEDKNNFFEKRRQ